MMETGFAMLIPSGPMSWPDGTRMLMIYHKELWLQYLHQTGRIAEIEGMTGPQRDQAYLKWCAETGRKNESTEKWTKEGDAIKWSSGK